MVHQWPQHRSHHPKWADQRIRGPGRQLFPENRLGTHGNLWFTGGNSIGRITPSGQITEFPVPTNNSIPEGIAAGPDGNLWFTETSNVGNKIGRITPGVPGVQIGDTRALVSHDMLTLELACAGGSAGTACRGALRLRIRVNRRFHRLRLTNSKALVIARGRYSLPSEHSGRIVLRLGRHALILLTRHHRLRVSATATVLGGQGASREPTGEAGAPQQAPVGARSVTSGPREKAVGTRKPRLPAGRSVFLIALVSSSFVSALRQRLGRDGKDDLLLPSAAARAVAMTAGPDGNVWFARVIYYYSYEDEIGRVTPSGQATEFPLPSKEPGKSGLPAIVTRRDRQPLVYREHCQPDRPHHH